jgi:hypothetical protein
MSKYPLIRSIACTSACLICSALALSPALAADFPAGRYKAQDILLSFDDKGQFQVNNGATLEVSGTYSVKEGRIELTDVKGPWACTDSGQQKGTYDWKFDGTALTFSKVTDSCDDRAKSLVPAAWKRQK